MNRNQVRPSIEGAMQMRRKTSFGPASFASIALGGFVFFWPLSSFAQSLSSPADYAREENRRVLTELIEETQEALRTLDAPESATGSRQSRNRRARGQPRIVNGRGTIDYPTTAALLYGADKGSAKAQCTATLIECDKILTAAHCVEDDAEPKNYKAYFHSAGFFNVTKIEVPAEYNRASLDADIAIITLDRPVQGIAPDQPNRVANILHDTEAVIVGFGRTGGPKEDYGLKREGFVSTASCKPQGRSDNKFLCWNFDVEVKTGTARSNTCHGDSGGPLFINEVTGGRLVRTVVGVTSGGDDDSQCLIGDKAFDTNIFYYTKWLDERGIARTPPATCGGRANINVLRDVAGQTHTLSQSNPQVVHSLDIGDSTARLMVAMNGEDNGQRKNDFDLYLMRGSNPNVAGAVCKEDGPGQFAFCDVPDPAPGKWTIVLKRKIGRGAVQVVVTKVPKSAVP